MTTLSDLVHVPTNAYITMKQYGWNYIITMLPNPQLGHKTLIIMERLWDGLEIDVKSPMLWNICQSWTMHIFGLLQQCDRMNGPATASMCTLLPERGMQIPWWVSKPGES